VRIPGSARHEIVNSAQMRHIDDITIHERGIPGAILMERAGKAVAREALDRFEPDAVAIITARAITREMVLSQRAELHRLGVPVTFVLLRPPNEFKGDALDAWRQVPDAVERLIEPRRQRSAKT